MASEKRKERKLEETTTADETVSERVIHTEAAKEATRLINRRYEEARDMEKTGRPVAWLYYGPPHEILQCFDIVDLYPENFGAACAIEGKTSPFLEYAEELGLSTNTCSYLRMEIGISRCIARGESTADAPYGGMARPTMFITTGRHCDPRVKVFDATRRFLDIPVFMYDYNSPPSEDPRMADRKTCKHYIDHNVNGYKALIGFLEEQTGKKLDWDRFTELVRNSVEMWHLFYDITQMRKNTPCPMPSGDGFIICRPYLDMTGDEEAVRFYRNTKRELEKRIKLGVSVVPEEKYRVMWLGLPIWLDMGIFNYLESKGAVAVIETAMHPYLPHEVDLSDPLRALAEKWFWGWDGGGADGSQIRCGSMVGGNHILDLVKEYNIDGVIAHSVISCRTVSIGMKHMVKLLRDQAGLPVLFLESDMSDPRAYSKTKAREEVDAFVQMLEGRRK